MADDTSGAERTPRVRETLHFGTIVVVGGGCYGSYYVRQLGRAAAAGAADWDQLVVVDRDAACPFALPAGQRSRAMRRTSATPAGRSMDRSSFTARTGRTASG